jgi:protein disulfide-isomerase
MNVARSAIPKSIKTEDPVNTSESQTNSPKRKPHPFWRWFWLTFLVTSLGYAGYSFYVPSNEVVWAEDIAAAREVASESGKPVMLFFTATWCVPCRIMKREVFAESEVMKAINAQVVPVMVYEDSPGGEAAFSQYNVEGTPITIFTDPQGNVLDYAVGGIGKDAFMEMLGKLRK